MARKPRIKEGAFITQDGRRFPFKMLTEARGRKLIKPYAQRIGEIAIHWNWLHENLAKIFEFVVQSPHHRLAQSVWYTPEGDYVQRKMLRNALKYANHLTVSQKDGIEYLLNTVEEPLRHRRNDAIHAPLVFVTGIVGDAVQTILQANVMSESPRAKSLNAVTDLENELDHYAMVAERLADHARLIHRALTLPAHQPWPEKPDMQRKPRKNKGRRGRKTDRKPDQEPPLPPESSEE